MLPGNSAQSASPLVAQTTLCEKKSKIQLVASLAGEMHDLEDQLNIQRDSCQQMQQIIDNMEGRLRALR